MCIRGQPWLSIVVYSLLRLLYHHLNTYISVRYKTFLKCEHLKRVCGTVSDAVRQMNMNISISRTADYDEQFINYDTKPLNGS